MKLLESINLIILLFISIVSVFIGISFYNMDRDLTNLNKFIS
jgi:hypothetical protein